MERVAVRKRASKAANDPLTLSSPLQSLKGVGQHAAEHLRRLGLETVRDLLFHLPLRYQDRTRLVDIDSLQPGEEALIEAEILSNEVAFRGRRMLLIQALDSSGVIGLRFFHFSSKQRESLAVGRSFRFFGEVRPVAGQMEMIHPEYQPVNSVTQHSLEQTLTPVYPAGVGVSQPLLRKLVMQALQLIADSDSEQALLYDYLSEEERMCLPQLTKALVELHRPQPGAQAALIKQFKHPAQQRLIFEELLVQQLALQLLRQRTLQQSAPCCDNQGQWLLRWVAQLPFALTGAQQRTINEIDADLRRSIPMQRLVQGDVGSGKTVVALAAVLRVLESGYQAAVMAPTELLAEQHYRVFSQWLRPLDIEVVWLSGKLKINERQQVLARIASAATLVAVGTHALFQEQVVFDRLGLVVIDEQHRFGVHQRLALREKGRQRHHYPHQLVMTATPIPRTLVMSAYGDLDVSVIDELPPGRKPVTTVIIPGQRRQQVLQRVNHACLAGRQAYWVCTLIEESDALQCEAATATAVLLQQQLPDLRIGLIHGRLKAEEKEAMMSAFRQGEIDLLVATTVIEVGVDVPNASLMVIENSDRLGLAQLHQLRGRIGRGQEQSSCVLMYDGKLGQRARERLQVMRDSSDGFTIAQRDLEIRGPGEILGTRQAGMMQFRIADVLRDQALIPAVNRSAKRLMTRTPEAVKPMIERWLGRAVNYGDV